MIFHETGNPPYTGEVGWKGRVSGVVTLPQTKCRQSRSWTDSCSRQDYPEFSTTHSPVKLWEPQGQCESKDELKMVSDGPFQKGGQFQGPNISSTGVGGGVHVVCVYVRVSARACVRVCEVQQSKDPVKDTLQ